MKHLGEFSTHRRVGEYVVKRLTKRHPAGYSFVAAARRAGVSGMRAYLVALEAAGVRLPCELEVAGATSPMVRHRWVHGPTLLDALDTVPSAFPSAIAEVGSWVRSLDALDARIDTNLANFCLANGKPVLVDVLPPLIPSQRSHPETLFDRLFTGLCFDTGVILDALCGYALRYALRSATPSIIDDLLHAVHELTRKSDGGNGLPQRWFRARLRIALRAARGDIDHAVAHDFFTLTSVLAFRQLDELARRRRVDEVADRMRDLRL